VTADGAERALVRGVQIFPDSTANQNIDLDVSGAAEEVIDISEPVLYGQYPSKIPEEDTKPLPPSLGFVVLAEPVIPEYIVVHAGAPTDASARDYWIPFKDYIKNVASCEIYSTWPENTIRANILAIISFTLNRVYTEWYRAKGNNFTITNSTAFDHAFNYGRNIYQNISNIVDELFNTFITKPDIRQPLLTQYCDGRRVQCPDWMTQWGSKDFGERGYSAIDILKSFYGSDIYLMSAQKVTGVPVSFDGNNLQTGSISGAVRTVQEQLNAISDNYPAIPKVAVDGVFGAGTLAAVETFQTVFKLPATGIVDFATWYRISDIYVAVERIAELQ
jgi:peptidoglycan hydrolase-like protein with peptidoglycan-binding domain